MEVCFLFYKSTAVGQIVTVHILKIRLARGKRKRADYLLYYKPNIPIAIVEAKDNKHSVGAGMQQGLEYAEMLDVPFIYSSNGDGFLEHDRKLGTEREIKLDEFPSPEELWQRYLGEENFTLEQEKLILLFKLYIDFGNPSTRKRYYF